MKKVAMDVDAVPVVSARRCLQSAVVVLRELALEADGIGGVGLVEEAIGLGQALGHVVTARCIIQAPLDPAIASAVAMLDAVADRLRSLISSAKEGGVALCAIELELFMAQHIDAPQEQDAPVGQHDAAPSWAWLEVAS